MTEHGHAARDRHLFAPGPKRILGLDGGGTRGIISIAFLERIEKLLRESTGDRDVRLCDYFDLIGGTSTGAIIGSALALGMTTREVKDLYFDLAPKIFVSSMWRIRYLRPRFDAAALSRELKQIIGDRALDTADLLTGYCVVAKRVDTGSPWIMSNNPGSPYWETPADQSYLGNRHYRLANLIRASTAAPTYFDPESLPIGDNLRHGLFVDGGVSPYNNPTIALLMLSQLKAFKLCWPANPQDLKIVSIGTGTHRKRMGSNRQWSLLDTFTVAIPSLRTVIDDAELQSLMLMQWLGDCPQRWWINSEIVEMPDDRAPHGPLFRFFRYDMRLEQEWFREQLGLEVEARLLNRIRELDEVPSMQKSYEIACKVAEQQVRPEDWTWPERTKPRVA